MLNFLLDLLFPKYCVDCGKIDTYFCVPCENNILQKELICPFCSRLSLGGATHPVCRRRYGLDGLWSLGAYEDPLRKAIQKLKYRSLKEIAESLVDITLKYWVKHKLILFEQILKDKKEEWVVVPVPLYWQRQNWRGFNQSSLIAKNFAQKLGLKYQECLKRNKNTKPQVNLEAHERKQNVKNAFNLAKNIKQTTQNYLLIDDVWTTGSTLKECCYTLKKNGAKKVWALTIAR